MVDIAQLMVKVGADIADFTSDMTTVENRIDTLGGRISSGIASAGESLIGFGAKWTAITAPVTAFGAIGIHTAADFQASMAEISARTGIVGDDLEMIRQFALDMGADTAFSAQQAADAFLQLLASGQTAGEAIETLPTILTAAAASGEDLGRTADVITDIMASFNLNISDAAMVVDALAQAAGASSADMSSLGQGFANVGGIANTFGLTVEDTAAILAIFSENGIKGAEAGTQLKSMLLNMTRPTEEVLGAWNDLNLSMYDTQGNILPLEDVIADLDRALDALPLQDQHELMKTLGGSYGIMGLTALRSSISISEMRDRMDEQASATDVAAARMETFWGRIDSLKGSIETLMITALTPFIEDNLTPLAETATTVINAITDWTAENPELTATIVQIGAAAVVAGPALIGIGTAMTLAAPAVALLLGPVGLLAAGFVGLAAVLSNPTVQGGLAVFGESVAGLAAGITDSFAGLDFSQVAPVMETHFDDIMTGIVSVAGVVFGGPLGLAIGGAQLVSSAIENDFLGIGTFLESSGISSAVSDAFTDVKAGIDSIIQDVFGGGAAPADDFLPIPTGAGGGADGGPLALFVSDIRAGLVAAQDLIDTVWGNLQPGLQSMADGITGFFAAFEDTETGGLLRIVTVIGGVIGAIAGAAIELGSEVLGTLLTAVGNALPMIGEGISDLITTFSRIGEGDWEGAADSLGNVFIDLGQAVLDFFGIDIEIPDFATMIDGWRTFFESVSGIVDFFGNEIAVGVRGFLRDVQQEFLTFQLNAHTLLAGLGLEDESIAQAFQSALDASHIAEEIETGINSGLESGQINLDLAKLNYVFSSAADAQAGADVTQLIASQIVDPRAIQAGIDASIAAGDTETLTALLPLSLELAENPAIQMQELLTAALESGGEEGEAFQALLPMATDLDIDVAAITQQYREAVLAAAEGQTFDVVVKANVGVDVQSVGLQEVGMAAAGIAPQAVPGIPRFATGGVMPHSGLAYLEEGEVILNNQQQAALGGRSGTSVTINNTYSVEAMLAELRRQGIDLEEMAGKK